MCGIVGLFLKDKSLEPELGALLSSMLVTMTDRGPDSAGIAIYGDASRRQGEDHHPVRQSEEGFRRSRRGAERALDALSLDRGQKHAMPSSRCRRTGSTKAARR